MSREESLWQTELKDLIWLELQAYHADRTPIEEDEYLCSARESVEPLLQNIMNYRFKRFAIMLIKHSGYYCDLLILDIQKSIVHKTAIVALKTTVLDVVLYTVVHAWKLKMTL